ncbi:MAG: amino acid ABC transporter permease [Desulfarculus sp.]|nr:amino acid ABC transporter permease [Desulfarculus sp.]
MLKYHFDWGTVLSGRYLDWLLSGVVVTLEISALSLALAMFLGVLVAMLRLGPLGFLRRLAQAYLEFFRNTPLLVQIFFWYFGSYKILPQALNDWLATTNFEFAAGVVALGIYTSAFIAEDIRSGVRAIPKEQMEAARSAGFGYLGAMRHVILPQAVRITIPPLVNQFLNLTKNSSLAMTIGVAELTYQARQVESYSFKGLEAFSAAALAYLLISLFIAGAVNLYTRWVLRPAAGR